VTSAPPSPVEAPPVAGSSDPFDRPDLLAMGEGLLRPMEKLQIRIIRRSFEPGKVDRTLRWMQRNVGASWIDYCTRNLRHVYGEDRLPELDPKRSYLCVCNHRTFFDLYLVTMLLVRRGLPHRMLFPVRSNFFYEKTAGFAVNGAMSFFAMYPPIFRDKSRAALNRAGVDEVVWMARRGGAFIGMHPEGTRNRDGDPYTLLPARSGVGRIIRHSNVVVLPVFVNGLVGGFVDQIAGNAKRTGPPVIAVFGAPVDFDDLKQQSAGPSVYKRIANRCLDAIRGLGAEEREIRAKVTQGPPAV
jgi:1-acyl-sn-glycerol-3-phosphate acyltransferase